MFDNLPYEAQSHDSAGPESLRQLDVEVTAGCWFNLVDIFLLVSSSDSIKKTGFLCLYVKVDHVMTYIPGCYRISVEMLLLFQCWLCCSGPLPLCADLNTVHSFHHPVLLVHLGHAG